MDTGLPALSVPICFLKYYIKHGNYFTVYVSQTIILYILNLYSEVCQLYLNKTGGKSKKLKNK